MLEHGMDVAIVGALPVWANEPALVRTLDPPNHGYGRMRVALDRYETLAETGGFIDLDERILRRTRPKRSHRAIATLRQRLAQEDPLLAPEGDTWDDELTRALRRARAAYQLRRGKARRYLIDKHLLEHLARPVEVRLETVRLNLRRWRVSERRHFDYAVQVNLPDYHGEVWDGDERLRRFKIVIGNTRKSGGSMINATPNISSAIRTVIFNPYWNVPRRIAVEELVPKAHRALTKAADAVEEAGEVVDRENIHSPEATAEWFEANGYDVLNQSKSGRMWIRQRPGPGNALGKVKFLFDNRDSIFMHDTPSKAKFHFPRRAFSHGCMRVQKPVELAKLLLGRDGSWSRHREYVGMRTQKQLVIPMERPIRLVVDYITNHVDDHGRVHWLHDIYRRDAGVSVASRQTDSELR
jgi:murein L,D-transpeptidase YcbB/YkuD